MKPNARIKHEKGDRRIAYGCGPEVRFGIYMEKLGDPILIIKTAWGGRSLMTDFRPPGTGTRVFNDFIKERWNLQKTQGQK